MKADGVEKFADIFKHEQYSKLMTEAEFMVVSDKYFLSNNLSASEIMTLSILAIENAYEKMFEDGIGEEKINEVTKALEKLVGMSRDQAKEVLDHGGRKLVTE
jgi:hypothetical protein|nr:MAG TPA: hypothetical protein [Caudoviricetes sp.]